MCSQKPRRVGRRRRGRNDARRCGGGKVPEQMLMEWMVNLPPFVEKLHEDLVRVQVRLELAKSGNGALMK